MNNRQDCQGEENTQPPIKVTDQEIKLGPFFFLTGNGVQCLQWKNKKRIKPLCFGTMTFSLQFQRPKFLLEIFSFERFKQGAFSKEISPMNKTIMSNETCVTNMSKGLIYISFVSSSVSTSRYKSLLIAFQLFAKYP